MPYNPHTSYTSRNVVLSCEASGYLEQAFWDLTALKPSSVWHPVLVSLSCMLWWVEKKGTVVHLNYCVRTSSISKDWAAL